MTRRSRSRLRRLAIRAAGSLLLPLGWGVAVVLLPAALACYLGAATAITGLAMLHGDRA